MNTFTSIGGKNTIIKSYSSSKVIIMSERWKARNGYNSHRECLNLNKSIMVIGRLVGTEGTERDHSEWFLEKGEWDSSIFTFTVNGTTSQVVLGRFNEVIELFHAADDVTKYLEVVRKYSFVLNHSVDIDDILKLSDPLRVPLLKVIMQTINCHPQTMLRTLIQDGYEGRALQEITRTLISDGVITAYDELFDLALEYNRLETAEIIKDGQIPTLKGTLEEPKD